ncbi:restriction endonuclease subunit S [Brachyspira sp. SAP_772]|uniref:restriction endonuclease subunit S n=1 Tax=Brachyspira sp. SAP_772 TaxID=2608385 RepID=UPI0012F4DADA|nr:restriction endonuclease subunit S [Brachyspira sp. SAP_772]
MSTLKEFLKKHCPDGVEYKTLSELGSFYAGLNGKKKDDFKDGNAKYITYMNVFSNLSVNTNINDTVQIGEKEKQNIVKYGDIIFTGSSETIEECGMSSVVTNELNEKLYLNSFCFGFRFNEPEIMLPDFSKYLFRSTELRKKIIKTASGVTRFNVSKKKMGKIFIPIPPIEVQKEIVRILDTFTKYQDLLNRELELRKKQYEYYRDKLLTFGDEVEYVPLWSVTIWDKKFNSVDRKKQPEVINYPYLLASDLFAMEQDSGDVFLLSTGEKTGWTTEKIAGNNLCNGEVVTIPWGKSRAVIDCIKYYKGKFVTADNRIMTSKDKSKLNNKFLYYIVMSKGKLIDTFYRGSGIKHPDMSKVLDIIIPLPPLEEQERIVKILDQFDTLCNDITRGLPAEIELRKKQYEYYRDKLLTFKEKNK